MPGSRLYFLTLSMAALGIVFGDIGTSPLYALQTCFNPEYGIAVTHENVLGILSLIFWALTLVVTVKYLIFVLRADNEGEGGILALMALVHESIGGRENSKRRWIIVTLGLFGAALLYGDGMITPAISVLSAMEGLEIASPEFAKYVVPLTVIILVGLFLIQRHGTAAVGKLFGPVMVVWFVVLGTLGVTGILQNPAVLSALNPYHAISFLVAHGIAGFLVLGAVFLAVTGAEALYADMGHLGREPIRAAWLFVAFPALVLNYFGQGALILQEPAAVANPFYHLAPDWALVPMIVLSTVATIIASQAIISGAFSLTMQAVQLGYSPRLDIRHTSEREFGQIYVPAVNWALAIATVGLVLLFEHSAALASAYGIAVTSTMLITSILFGVVAHHRWGWSLGVVVPLVAAFIAIEIAFFLANVVKVIHGGFLPIAVAAGVFVLMTTWRQGRRVLGDRLQATSVPMEKFLEDLQKKPPTRVRGNAVYMTGNPRSAPHALIKNLEHNRVLHFQVAMMSLVTEDVPHVPADQRVTFEALGNGFYRVVARYGFMDEPNAIEVLTLLRAKGLKLPLDDTTFFLGRERLTPSKASGIAPWRGKLFGFMARNAQQATAYFRIPPDRVVEVGSQVEL